MLGRVQHIWNILHSVFKRSPPPEADFRRAPPHPANVPGSFYVEDGCCISCGVWEDAAPDLLAWLPDAKLPHCYVQRQPETDAEFARMKKAMDMADVDCIRVHACKPEWMEALRKAGLDQQIDPASGPISRD